MKANFLSARRKPTASAGAVRGISDWERLAFSAQYDLGKLARLCNVSMETLRLHFERGGVDVKTWLRGARLAMAYQQVSEGEPLGGLARKFGYKDCRAFIREFTQEFGVAPLWLSPREVRSGGRT